MVGVAQNSTHAVLDLPADKMEAARAHLAEDHGDVRVMSLGEAVDIMGRLQLGRQFTPEENALIVAFLRTLTGEQPSFTLPVLPPSTDRTPKPVPLG